MSNREEDFEPNFDMNDEEYMNDEHEEHNEHDEDNSPVSRASEKRKPDLKKFAIPAVAVVLIGGLVFEGGKIKNMIMGTPTQTVIPHNNIPHRNFNPNVPTPSGVNNNVQNPLPVANNSIPSQPQEAIQPPSFNNIQNGGVHLPNVMPDNQPHNVNQSIPGIPSNVPSAPVVAKPEPVSNVTDFINALHENIDPVVTGQKEIKESISNGVTTINTHTDEKAQALSDKIDELNKKAEDISSKLDALNKPVVKSQDKEETKGAVLGHHNKVKPKKTYHVKVASKAPVKVETATHGIASYHLTGVSKNGARIVDNNGNTSVVQLGSTPTGTVGNATGLIQGIGKNDDGSWFLQTANGKINE